MLPLYEVNQFKLGSVSKNRSRKDDFAAAADQTASRNVSAVFSRTADRDNSDVMRARPIILQDRSKR